MHFSKTLRRFFAWLEQLTGGATQSASIDTLPQQLAAEINDFKLNTSLMNAVLRSYQTFGAKYILHQKHSLLGDEMGLGKTMQAIAAMAHLRAEGKSHFLVVCPVSVMINWIREIVKHSKLTATKIHGNNRQQEFTDWQSNGGVAVTTYETISRLEFDVLQLDMLVVDEAHYIKNPNTIRTKALVKFTSITEYILFMTGTPIENKVDEMIFLISLLNSEIAQSVEQIKSLSSAPEFREKIAQVYLRRVREDVLTELPEKLEKEEWCIMTSAEEQTYKQTLMEGSYMKIRQVSWNTPQISDSSKANRLLEICADAEANGRKVLVFSFFLNTIEKIRQMLGSKCYGPINGSVSADQRQAIVDEFTNAPAGSVLLSQITAGGVGLNIQTASVVIICEPQWKPSTENQAISRVYRMGQSNNVVVHRLLADDTVDEKITDILKGKTEIFKNFADESAIDEASKSIDENKAMAAILKDEREKYGVSAQQQ